MPSPKIIPPRWPFYTIALLSALFQIFITLNNTSINTASWSSLPSFATASAIIAIVTFLWIAILLCYGGSETENEHALTRCYTHIISFGIISAIWLGLGEFLAIHASRECQHHPNPTCLPLWFSTLLAFLISLFSCLSAAIVICPIAVACVGCNTHVEHARKSAIDRDMNRGLPGDEAGLDTPQDISLPNLPLAAHLPLNGNRLS